MSKELKCPKCGSNNILTERRPDGFHCCLECQHRWKIGESQPKQSVFARITASPDVLAPYLVFFSARDNGWCSMLTIGSYDTYKEAIAATVAKLNEVEK